LSRSARARSPDTLSQEDQERCTVSAQKEKPRVLRYVVGGLSYIPLIGVLFGIVAIIWGLATMKTGGRKLAFIGGGGIVFTVVLYSGLFYFGAIQRGGVYDNLRKRSAETAITSLVQAIEFYRTENGHYPESLEVLRNSLPKGSLIFVFDPTDVNLGGKSRLFHYELVDAGHYYLLGVGPDDTPFTQDDILPKVNVGPASKVGLLIKSQN